MPVKSTSRRRTAEGDVVQVRLRDRHQLIALRMGRPDEKGRPGRSLTQRQAAAHVGISHGHYGDLEAGRRQPSFAVGQRLAAFFDVDLETLCDVLPLAAPVSPRSASAAEVAHQGGRRQQDEVPVVGGGDGLEGS